MAYVVQSLHCEERQLGINKVAIQHLLLIDPRCSQRWNAHAISNEDNDSISQLILRDKSLSRPIPELRLKEVYIKEALTSLCLFMELVSIEEVKIKA